MCNYHRKHNLGNGKGNLVETLVSSGANREEASYGELPEHLINAFVAIEIGNHYGRTGYLSSGTWFIKSLEFCVKKFMKRI